MNTTPRTGLQLRSLIRRSGELEFSLVDVPVPPPGPDEVVVRVEAAPINPSDLGLLFGAADMARTASGRRAQPASPPASPTRAMKAMAGRLEQSMPVGNEGAGVVVEAGASAAAQALLGKTVAVARRRDVFAVPLRESRAVPAAARRHDAGRRRVVPSSTR